MSAGELKIIRVMANPKGPHKAKAAPRKKKKARRRHLKRGKRAHSTAYQFLLQATIYRNGGAGNVYWSGKAWGSRKSAKRYPKPPTAMDATARTKLPAGWVAINTVPA